MMSTDFCQRSQSCVIVAAAVVVVVVSSFFKTKRVFFQRALTHVVQEPVHPSVDGHASDGVVDEVHLPGQRVSVSITRYESYYHCFLYSGSDASQTRNISVGVFFMLESSIQYDKRPPGALLTLGLKP